MTTEPPVKKKNTHRTQNQKLILHIYVKGNVTPGYKAARHTLQGTEDLHIFSGDVTQNVDTEDFLRFPYLTGLFHFTIHLQNQTQNPLSVGFLVILW